METYRKTNNAFFLECAYLRHAYGLGVLDLDHVLSGRWLTDNEIQDFTLAYMAGGEL